MQISKRICDSVKWSKVKNALASAYLIFIFITLGFINFIIIDIGINETGVQAAIIYVDSTGGGDYTSIQAAIDNATPGDTIIVANGTYYESVNVNKSNIKLVGNSSSDCKIIHHYVGSNYLTDYAAGINITASGVNITGFYISVSGNYTFGIFLNSSSSNSYITNNNITTIGDNGYGIFLYYSSNNNLTNNKINSFGQSGYGIYFYTSLNNNLTNNIINTTNRWGRGIYLYKSSNNNSLTYNTINITGQSGYGIYLSQSSNNNIVNNIINTTGMSKYGIYLYSFSNNNHLIDNIIKTTGVNGYGIYLLAYSSNNILISNTINTAAHGIYLNSYSNNNNLTSNTINTTGSGGYGIYLSSSSVNLLLSNSINTTGWMGDNIYLDSSSTNNNITNNKITFGSEANGIFIRFCSNNNISKNQIISSSGGFGIYLSNVKYANLSCNNFTNCGIKILGNSLDQWNTHTIEYTNTINIKPIYFYNDTSGVIIPNDAGEVIFVNCSNVKINNRTLIGGIQLAFTNHFVIENSTFNYNGIYLQSSNNNNLTNNKFNIKRKDLSDIYLSYSNNNNLINNKIRYSCGIGLSHSSNNNLMGNIIYNGGNGIGLSYSLNNNLIGNSINISGQYRAGIALNMYSNNNLISNNKINTSDEWTKSIVFSRSWNNNITNNIMNTIGENAMGIYLERMSADNDVINNTIKVTGNNGNGIGLDASIIKNLTNNIIKIIGYNAWGIGAWSSGVGGSLIYKLNENNIYTNGERAYGICLEKGCGINDILNNQINTSGKWGHGIYIYRGLNINIKYNDIVTNGERGYGIYHYNSSDNKLISNNITTYGLRGDGIYFQQSSNNEISKNQINTSGGAYGIFIYQDSNNNNIIASNISTKGENGHGIYSLNSKNNNILNCNITTSGLNTHGFYLDSKFATIINTTLITNLGSYDIKAINNGEITLINSNFNTVQVTENGGGVLKVKNYLVIQVYDDDSITPISGVDIEVRDNNAQIYASTGYGGSDSATNSNGKVESIIVTDCWYYYSNYATENITKIKVKKVFTNLWEVIRSDVDMSTSHTEIFYHDITAPSIPTGLKVTRIPGTNSLNISWDLNQDTVKYKLYSNKTGQWEILSNVIHPQNWTLDEDLPDKTWYYYKIQALDKVDLSSELSEAVSYYLADITPPVIPSGLNVKPVLGGDMLNISWDLNPDNPLSYDITWDDPETKDWKIISNVIHPKVWYIFSHNSLVNGSTYYFKIRAYYKDILPSDFTSPVQVIHIDYLAPESPTGLKAKAISESEIVLSWEKSINDDVQGYKVYINQSSSGVNKTYNFFGETKNLDYNITGLIENTKYFFVIKAFDEANNTSPFSQETWTTTLIIPEQPRVISTIPIQNSTDIAVNTSVIIIFNVPMNILTVEKILDISPVIQYNLSWLKNNMELQIDFIKNLSYNTRYIITIGMSKSEAGLVLKDYPFILQFKTVKEKKFKPKIFKIIILYPKNGTIIKPDEKIEISGTSFGFENGTLISVALDEITKSGTIDINGNWSVILNTPEIEGNYSIRVSVGDINNSVYIIVKIDDEIQDENDKDKKEKDDFDKNMIIILTAIIIILIIVIIIFIMIKKKSSKKVQKDSDKKEMSKNESEQIELNEEEE